MRAISRSIANAAVVTSASATPAPASAASHGRNRQRLFFALWPDVALRRRIAAATMQLEATHRIGGRALQPARYHLTLQLLGDFDRAAQAVIDAAINAADEVRLPGFDLQLDCTGSFGGKRVGWLGPARVPPGLSALSAVLGLALDRQGVPRESAGLATWTPHVTVLRGMRRPLPALDIPPLAWAVDGFALVRSQSGYDVLQQWALADR